MRFSDYSHWKEVFMFDNIYLVFIIIIFIAAIFVAIFCFKKILCSRVGKGGGYSCFTQIKPSFN